MPSLTGLDEPSDAALAAAWRAGSEQAATDLVRRHASRLARFLSGAGAGPSEVEDLVQEAFFKAFRGLDGWRQDSSFRSWIFSIGSNLLKDAYRRRKGRVVLSIEDHDMPVHRDPGDEMVAEETAERITVGLTDLPRLQREVFLLRVQQGLDYAEIAASLGTTVGAARVHYHHAVKRLKELVP
ncbi:MAG TPA: RNA polymerase sigma factor [Gemmatimonadales bacterium]|nr:RNA polymerase sigma factor [Gemmatimonadales bacterium]